MRVVLSGGGTGGHIYPALSIARQCRAQHKDIELLYIGTQKGLEHTLVPKHNIPFESIDITGFRRKLSVDNIKTVMRFVQGVKRSKQLLKQFGADVVIGTGGYVCGPVVYAAAKLGIPTVIHEQNAIPGLTNKFLSRYADTVAVSFKESEPHFNRAKRVLFTGNPCASAVALADRKSGYSSLGIPAGSRIVLVVGGSRGAKAINEAMIEMTPLLHRLEGVYFVYVTGESYYPGTSERIERGNIKAPERLKVLPYVHNMPEVLAATSLIVSRSGASSLAEITALGIPSILIPSPNVTNNHQEANARSLANEQAAEMILEKDLSGQALFARIEAIIGDEKRWKSMSERAKTLGMPDSAKQIAEEIERLITLPR